MNRKDRDERRAVRSELRQLAKEERKRQEKAVEEVLSGAQVIGRRGALSAHAKAPWHALLCALLALAAAPVFSCHSVLLPFHCCSRWCAPR